VKVPCPAVAARTSPSDSPCGGRGVLAKRSGSSRPARSSRSHHPRARAGRRCRSFGPPEGKSENRQGEIGEGEGESEKQPDLHLHLDLRLHLHSITGPRTCTRNTCPPTRTCTCPPSLPKAVQVTSAPMVRAEGKGRRPLPLLQRNQGKRSECTCRCRSRCKCRARSSRPPAAGVQKPRLRQRSGCHWPPPPETVPPLPSSGDSTK
jgi:hypothetical protein